MNRFTDLFVLLRPKQWVKNGFVLAPLVFSGVFTDTDAILQAIVATLLFCVASSATYIVNDILDVEADRRHPVKCHTRPLAACRVSIPAACVELVFLYGVLLAGFVYQPNLVLVILGYLALNLAYSLWLKHHPVLDIFAIAVGFVLRVYGGAVALDVPVSSWMFITTLCLALYLASIKRRQELGQHGVAGRNSLNKYSVSLINRYAEISATGALIFYSMFVMSERPALMITIPMVLFGLFRYWYVVESTGDGESPTDVLLKDWQLSVVVAFWVATCIWILWPDIE